MKTEHKEVWKQILLVLSIGIVAFIIWEMVKAISAGVSDVTSILKAPFTALGSIWTGIKNIFSSSGSSSVGPDTALNSLTAGINNPVTGEPINDQTALQQILMNNFQPPAPSNYVTFDWTAQPTS